MITHIILNIACGVTNIACAFLSVLKPLKNCYSYFNITSRQMAQNFFQKTSRFLSGYTLKTLQFPSTPYRTRSKLNWKRKKDITK